MNDDELTVTGRTYRKTRVRGLAPWRPQRKTRVRLDDVLNVLAVYANQLPLSLRQVFYVLVGRHGYDKTEQAYSRLGELINRARRAGYISWDAIRDDGTVAITASGFYDPQDFWTTIRGWAERYQRILTEGQPRLVELWVEAGGMVPQVQRIADEYGVAVYSGGGFDSTTAKYEAARRFCDQDIETLVLHIGDYDPSGCAIIDSAASDVMAMCRDLTYPGIVEFERLAVTPAQIDAHGLPTAPPKADDRRGERMAFTVQAEALPPDVLATIVREGIERHLDLDVLAELRQAGETERTTILRRLGRLGRLESFDEDER
jgi:hypothetical protein